MQARRRPGQGARQTPRTLRRYRSGIRPLEDRVTMSAAPWSGLDHDEVTALLAGTNYVQNELIVALKNTATSFADVLAIESARDAVTTTAITAQKLLGAATVGGSQLYQLTLDAGANFADTLAAISNWTGVDWAAPNFVYTADPRDLAPNDPSYSSQYHHTTMQNNLAWDISQGSGVIVAVTDDGVDWDHADLAANIWNNPGEIAGNGIDDDANGYIDDVRGWDFSSNDNNPDEVGTDYHGTHVAGIIAAVTNNAVGVAGTAGQATIMPVRFYGSGSWTSTVIFNSYKYATDNGAKIISTSYNIDQFASDPTFASAVNYAYTRGVLHFNSAGNNSELDPARGNFDQMIFVASTNSSDQLSSYSNYGRKIDISAPGESIYSTLPNNTYGLLSGTSMATPNAAAVAALIWSAHPTWTRDQVAAQLLATADNIDALNPSYAGLVGTGRVNSYKALTQTIAPPKIKGLTEVTGATVGAINKLTVQTVSRFDETTVENSANWELRSDGADGVFNTADDQIIALTRATDYMIGSNEVVFNFATLATDRYRLTVKSGASGLKDPFGTQLDGDSDGTAGGDYVREFTVAGPIAVTSSTPANGSAVAPPLTAIDINFDRAYQTSSVTTSDLVLSRGTVSSVTFVDADTARFNVSGLTTDGSLTYSLAAGSVLGTDGTSLGAFTATVNLFSDIETPITLAALGPAHSLALAGSTSGSIGAADVDTFTLDLAAGQSLSLALVGAGALQGRLTVTGPGGTNVTASASAAGASVVLQNISIGTAGVYTITVDAAGGTGTYTLQALVNATYETESVGGVANNSLATAQDLSGAWLTSAGNASRAVVSGGFAPLGGNIGATGFETGALPTGWTTYSSLAGAHNSVGSTPAPAAGTYALYMDSGTNSSTYVLNEADWTVNLAGLSNVRLSFAQADFSDEEEALPTSFTGHANGDGVAFSVDGTTWYRLWNVVSQSSGVWTNYTLDLSAAAAAAGVTLGANTRIRFQQYDNNSYSGGDGRGWDQISLDGDVAAGPDDWYKLSLAAGESFSAAVYASTAPSTFELYNAAGNLVSIAQGDGIRRFNPSAAGDYYLRLSSSTAQPYSLVLAKNGDIDAAGNDSLAAAQRLAGPMQILGSATASDQDDYYYFRLTNGDILFATTSTPAVGSTAAVNAFDPALDLYDPSGNLLTTADDNAPDGRNASLNYVISQTGTYKLRVRATESTTGAYLLDISGMQPDFSDVFQITTVTPAAGSVVRQTLDTLTVTFSHAVDFTSLAAGDLTINGVAATGVTALSADTAKFTFTPPAAGPVNFAIAAGAVADLERRSVGAFAASLTYQPNRAPVLGPVPAFKLDTILEDQTNNNGTLVSALIATGSNGDPISDPDAGDPEGIAVTGAVTTNGTWQYSLDGGATWNALGAVSQSNARLLASDAQTRIRFVPAANYTAHVGGGLTLRAWDRFTGTNGGTADVGAGGGSSPFSSASTTADLDISPVNDPPSFTKGADQVVASTAVARSVTAWATNISQGPSEFGQTLTFLVSNDNNGLFSVQPSISSSGTLTYAPTAGASGTAVVSVRLMDDGGTLQGGVDTSAVQTFTISMSAAPTITSIASQTVLEDKATSGLIFTVADPDNAVGSLTVSTATTNSALTPTASRVLTNLGGGVYKLVVTPAANQTGTATITVSVSDGLSTTSTSFLLTVVAVNDAPSFTKGANQAVASDVGPRTISAWATSISQGSSETGQTLTFTTSNDNNSLFSVQPTVASDGTLSYTPALNASGTAVVSVQLKDNGGTEFGGVDTSAVQTFTITVGRRPVITPVADRLIDEDGSTTVLFSVTDSDTPAGSLVISTSTTNSTLTPTASRVVTDLGGGNYQLVVTPAANVSGGATITITVSDGVSNAGSSFVLTVNPVNDVPTFTKGADVTATYPGFQIIKGWATGISAGANENQVLTFSVSVDDPTLFSLLPTVTGAGDLMFAAAAGKTGTANVTLQLSDNGGKSFGGVDTSAPQTFAIQVNTPPFAAGTLDPNFAAQGWGAVSLGTGNDRANDFAVLADGKIIVVGTTYNGFGTGLAVARLNRDGSLDATFGTGGVTTFGVSTGSDYSSPLMRVAIQSDGKIVASGSYYASAPQPLLIRLNADGSRDATFGSNGVVKASVGTNATFYDVTVQADGKIVAFGEAYPVGVIVARYNADGTPDTTFGTAGLRIVNLASTYESFGFAGLIQPDGKYVIAGSDVFDTGFHIYRLNADGSYDTTFGTGGFVRWNVSGDARGVHLLMQPDGKLVVTGVWSTGFLSSSSDAAVLRLNSNGTFDTTFGSGGLALLDSGYTLEGGASTVLLPDGDLIVGGFSGDSTSRGMLVRLNSDGSRDTSFGVGGYVRSGFGTGASSIASLKLLPDGNLMAAGYATPESTSEVLIARYLLSPSSTTGPTITPIANQSITEDGATGSILFSVSDASTPASALTVATSSSNSALFPATARVLTNFGGGDYRLVLTPAANQFGSATVWVTVGNGSTTTTTAVAVTVNPVNDAPSFVKGANQTITSGELARVAPGWATGISAGPNENQSLTFVTSNDNNGLFAVQPTIGPTGTLSYTFAPGVYGSATVTVSLQDDGGTAGGGVDTSAAQTFTITYAPAPTITPLSNVTINEDGSTAAILFSVADIDTPLASLAVTTSSSNSTLVPTASRVLTDLGGGNYRLVVTPAADRSGSATITVQASDGATTSQVFFSLTVTAVNDPPSFTKGADQTVFRIAGAQTVTNWATGISQGPNETGQTLTFELANDNPSLFTAGPTVASNGTLTYTPSGIVGTAVVRVRLKDTGGTANGGGDTSDWQTLTIRVINTTSDTPAVTPLLDAAIGEDASTTVDFTVSHPTIPAGSLTVTASSNDATLLPASGLVLTNFGNGQWRLAATPAANRFGAAIVTVLVNDGMATVAESFTLTVNPVNDAPSFVKGADQGGANTAGLQLVADWATSISSGPNETGQGLAFQVTNDNNGLFSVQPTISPNGMLSYALAAGAAGTATVSVRLQDDGGTAGGGVDTSAVQTFTISVLAAPTIPVIADQQGLEDVPLVVAVTIDDVDTPPQGLAVTASSGNATLLPSTSLSVAYSHGNVWLVTAPPAADQNGTVIVTVSAFDGASTTTRAYQISFNPVNDAPSFTKGANQSVVSDGSAKSVTNWATALSPGPNETGQGLSFLVTNNNAGLFAVQPAISSTGTLTYTLAAGALGTATVTVRLQDDGGTANVGVDTSAAQTFTITVTPSPNIVVRSSTPANASFAIVPLTAITVDFDRAYLSSSVSASDLTLSRGTVSSVTLVDSDTVRFDVAGLTTAGPLTYSLAAASVLGTDGSSLGAFTATVNLFTDVETPITLAPLGPGLSLALAGSTSGQIHPGDVDTFTLDLAAGQSLSLALLAATTLQGRLTVTGPGGTNVAATASDLGASALLQNIPIVAAGFYTVTVDAAAGTGTYTLQALVNATAETEAVGGAANDSRATSQDLAGAWLTLPGGGSRAVVSGGWAPLGGNLATIGFETGMLPSGWTTYKSLATGQNAVGSSPTPAAGTYALYMAGDTSGNYNLNEAEWAVNLAGASNVRLTFSEAYFLDELDTMPATFTGHGNGDGIALSVDGTNWFRIWTPTDVSSTWTSYTVNLSTAAAAAGVTLGANTRIRFQQYDNFEMGTDGRGWDQISLDADVASGPDDWYKVSLAAGESFSAAAYAATLPSTFELYDSAGNRLTTAGNLGAGYGIDGFTSASGGDYYLRLSSSVTQPYQLVLTRGAAIDLGGNDTAALAQGVAGNQPSVLGTTAAGDDDYYLIRLSGSGLYTASTETPAVGSSSSTNLLDPALELYDSAGNLVASADDTSPDGRNATLSFQPAQDGVYRLRVFATQGTSGAYVLRQSGLGGVPEATHAVSTNPAVGATVRTQFNSLTVQFSDVLLLSSLSAGDLTVNGVAATGFTLNSGNSVTFAFAPPAAGPVTLAVAAGALSDVSGNPVDALDLQVIYQPNNAPVLVGTPALTLDPIFEDQTANPGMLVSALLVTGAGGDPISDLDAGDPEGIAVTAALTTNGSWQYSLNNGTTWSALGSVSQSNARLLASDTQTRIRFVPAANFNGTVTGGLTFRAWDRVTGTNGGTANVGAGGGLTAFSTATGTANLSVAAVNDAPSFTKGANQTVNSDGSAKTVTNWATAISAGPSETGQTLTFLVTNDNNGLFAVQPSISSNGTLTYTLAAGAVGTANVTVRLQDDGGTANGGVDTSAPQTFGISLVTAPTINIISTTPANGSSLAPPLTAIDVTFDRSYQTSSVTTSDLVLSRGTVSSVTYVDADTVRFNVTGLTTEGTLTYSLTAGSVLGSDGTSISAFSATVQLFADVEAPIALAPLGPALSLALGGSTSDQIHPGDIDTYTLDLAAGQSLSLALDGAGALQGRLTVTGPGGFSATATASAAGGTAFLQNVSLTASGIYTIKVDAAAGTGTYTLQALVNATAETESVGGVGNDSQATAQDLSGAWLTLAAGSSRLVVNGSSAPPGGNVATIGFETGALPAGWTTYSSLAGGRNAVGNSPAPAAGAYALYMDAGTASTYNLNEAEWTVNLAGLTNVRLSFAQAEWDDEEQSVPVSFTGHANADGIAFSVDGVTWYRLWDAVNQSTSGAWSNYTVNLSTAAAAAGVTLGANTRIRFQQYDDFAISTDGRGWDQISLDADLASGPEDWYRVALAAGESFTAAVYAATAPSIFELYDAAGNRLAAAANLGATFGIAGFTSAAGGDYYLRINSTAPQAYQLVLGRGAALDRGANDAPDQAQPIGTGQFTLLGATASGDDDYYLVRLNANQAFTASTDTPSVGSSTATNTLDPALDLYDSAGNLVASADDELGGRNAQLSYTSSGGGLFKLRVRATEGTSGAYLVNLSGLTNTPEATHVIATSFTAGTVRTTQTSLSVQFSDQVLLTSPAAGDLSVNGVAATGFTVDSGDTVTFSFAEPAEGPVTFTIAAGAILDLRGQAVDPLILQIDYQPNDAPVLDPSTPLSLAPILEDDGANNGTLIAALLATGAGGNPITDPDAGDPEGIAVTAAETAHGSWQYSLDDGATWNALGAVSPANARLLAADAATRIRFVPAANFNGLVASGLTLRAWDRSAGTNGGTADVGAGGADTAFSSASGWANISVTAVNDAPSFTVAPVFYADLSGGPVIANNWIKSISPGPLESGQALAFSVSVDDPSWFVEGPSIDSAGTLRFRGVAGTTGSAFVTVRLHDDGGIANGGVDISPFKTFEIRFTDSQFLSSGMLDPTFDADGIARVVSPFGSNEVVRDVARQADGKYVVLSGPSNVDQPHALLRYNSDGTLDTSFGEGGRVVLSVGTPASTTRFTSLEIAADGKILVAGNVTTAIAVLRFNADGTADLSFNGAGMMSFTPSGNSTVTSQFPVAMALASDGKIVLTSYYRLSGGNLDTVVARVTTAGALDTTFSSTGYRTLTVSSSADDAPYDVAVQGDGKIVVVGVVGTGTSSDFYAARLTATGALDSTFGSGGLVVVNMGATTVADTATRVALQTDGKILVGGTTNGDFGLLRLSADGTIDTSFGAAGKVITNISSTDQLLGLAVQADGKIVAAGSATGSGTGLDFAVARYTTAGTLDSTFDGDGVKTFAPTGSSDVVNVLLAQSDGKLVVGGFATTADGASDLALGRLLSNGAADGTFGSGGFAYLNLDQASSTASATLLLPDGRILVAGTVNSDGTSVSGRWMISRLGADGRLDTTFGTGGYAAANFGSSSVTVVDLARQSDGKILLLTTTSIIRLSADGVVDSSFGTAGTLSLTGFLTGAFAAEVGADDSITIAGYKTNSASGFQEIAVVRLLAGGAADTSFSGDGVALIDVGAESDQGLALAVQADGKILVAGSADNGPNLDFALVRLNADGSLDTMFAGDGTVTAVVGSGSDFARGVVVQDDGKIVVGGTSNGDFALARFTADGTLDPTFSGDGMVVFGDALDTDEIDSLFSRPDGTLLAVGLRRGSSGTSLRLAALRILADGSVDPLFDGDPDGGGVVSFSAASTTSSTSFVADAALQPDGDVIVVGRVMHQVRTDAAVFRLLTGDAAAGAAPTVTSVADRSIDEGGSFSFTFTVADPDTPLDWLRVSVAGSDPSLFTAENSTLTNLGGGLWSYSAVARPNQFGASVVTISVSDGSTTTREQATITVLPINDAPSFAKGADIQAVAGRATSIPLWARSIFAGGPDESAQVLSFEVVAADPSLFDSLPAIAADGTLSFAAKASAAGLSTLVTVRLRDDGGTARGGVDVSAPQTLTITVGNAPVITAAPDQTIAEGGTATFDFNVSDLDTPAAQITVSTASSNSALLSSMNLTNFGSGHYLITASPPADRFGTVKITVTAGDGAHATTREFVLNVTNVNDAPAFVKGLDQYAGAGAHSAARWASSITAGANESGQALHFVVAVDDPSLFAVLPTISADGTLSYTAAAGKSGVAVLTVRLQDDGGTADGGVDVSPDQTFRIRVLASDSTAGDFDSSFGGDGTVALPASFSSGIGRDLAVQADGKFVVVGGETPGLFGAAFAARYRADGTLDTSFGVGGIVRIDPSSTVVESATAVEIAADGKIYVAFNDNLNFNVARLNADGSFDASFGVGGIAVAAAATADVTTGMALQQDGKIVVVGSSSSDLAATRFNVDGTVDLTFGVGGYFRQSIGISSAERLYDVAVQNDGRIVATGTGTVTGATTGQDVVVIRLSRDGQLDASFDGDGIRTAAAPATTTGTDQGNRIALDGNDRIVVAGVSNSRAMLLRLNTDGSFDATFDGDGWMTTSPFGTTEAFQALALRSDGRIVAAGSASAGAAHLAVASFNADGSFDLSFNGTGRALVAVGDASDSAFGAALTADGRIVVAGQAARSGSQLIALASLSSDGSLDRSFSGDGVQTTPLGIVSQQFGSVVRQSDGKYVVGGRDFRLGSGAMSISRYLADGTLDTSFGTGGFAYPASSSGTFALALQADGKIVGVSVGISTGTLFRLNVDGSLDTSFAGDGSATLPTNMAGYAVAVAADGKIIVAGQLSSNFAVARFNTDGTLDTTFSSDGLQTFDAGGTDGARAVSLLADGRIILAGLGSNGSNDDFVAARINADGSLDTSFDVDGWVRTAVGTGTDQAFSVVVQADGKIVLGGTTASSAVPTGIDWGFVRYNVDGSLDASFDGDGVKVFAPGSGDDAFGALQIQSDGRLVAVGAAVEGAAYDTVVARFLSDGRLDPTFADDGVLLASSSAGVDAAQGLSIDPDGKIVVAGYAEVNGRYEGRLLRLLNDVGHAPTVAGVYVRGSTWSASYLNYLDAGGWGAAAAAGLGYALAGGSSQLSTTIPWNNVDRITVRFDRDVDASLGTLTLYNSSGQGVSPLAWRYLDGRTVEFTVPTLAADKYLINVDAAMLDGIDDLALDGEWNTSVTTWTDGSGDGTAGGSFNFRFNVLPGDFDSSGSVSFGEIGQARLKLGMSTASLGYLYRQDYDGSGSITFGEIGQARGKLGSAISGFAEPAAPPDSLAFHESLERDIVAQPRMVEQEIIEPTIDPSDAESYVVDSFHLDGSVQVENSFPVDDLLRSSESPTESAEAEVLPAIDAVDSVDSAERSGPVESDSSVYAAADFADAPEFVASPLFFEPAEVVERAPVSFGSSWLSEVPVAVVPLAAAQAGSSPFGGASSAEFALGVRQTAFDASAVRFGTLASAVTVAGSARNGATFDPPSSVNGVRAHAGAVVRSEFRPAVRPLNADNHAAVSRFDSPTSSDAPRPWARLRRRAEAGPSSDLLAGAPSAEVGSPD